MNFSFAETLISSVPTIGQIKIPDYAPVKKQIATAPELINLDDLDVFDLLDMVNTDIPIVHTRSESPILIKRSKKKIAPTENKPEEIKENEEIDDKDDLEIPNFPKIEEKPYIFGEVIEKTQEKFEYAIRVALSVEEEQEYKRLLPTMARKVVCF